MNKNLDNSYFVIYSNYFKFEGKVYAFRKKTLFDITNTPQLKKQVDNNKCLGYYLNRKFLSLPKIKLLVINETFKVDISELQWFEQINIDLVINLE